MQLGVLLAKLDNDQELAIEYNVMSVPTLIIIQDGRETNRCVGFTTKEKIKELIK